MGETKKREQLQLHESPLNTFIGDETDRFTKLRTCYSFREENRSDFIKGVLFCVFSVKLCVTL